jgi:hypothetical protein
MIDFTKIAIKCHDLRLRLLNKKELVFVSIKNKQVAQHKNLTITLHDSGRVEVCGSLHKYWNGGLHNWNDFGRLDLWDVVRELCDWLEIEPQAARLHNIEFGVNLLVAFEPTEFLRGLLTYKDESFVRTAVNGSGFYKQSKKTQFIIKAYDKGKQYQRPDHILRFEVKVIKMEYLPMVQTLADLMDSNKLTTLGALLADAWGECIVVEKLDLKQLTKPETKTYQLATDARTWDNLDRVGRFRLRTNYTAIVERYANGGRKAEVTKLIETKWAELLAIPKTCNVLTDFQNAEMIRFDRSNIVSECINLESDIERQCLTTKVSIEHQKSWSRFVSEKTLKDNANIFEKLTNGRRCNKRKNQNTTVEYIAAHNARNDYFNDANNLRRKVLKSMAVPMLFEAAEVVGLSDSQKAILQRFEGSKFEVQI